MKKIYVLTAFLVAGGISHSQTIFESDLSTWSGGLPSDMVGSKTSLEADSTVEVTSGATYGTSLAQLINTESTHKRLTTQTVSVTQGTAYDIEIYVKGQGDIRTGIFDGDLDGNDFGYKYGSYISVNSATTTMYTQQMVADTNTSVAEFIVSVRNTVAANGHLQLDSIIVKTGVVNPPSTVSVYEIQYSTAFPAASPYEGQIVSTGGIVTYVRADGKFYIASGTGAYSGVYVFDGNHTVAVGDSVTFSAEVDEYFDLTELKNLTSVSIVSSGNFFMANSVTTAEANTEAYEGCLVSTCGQCTSAPNQYNEYPVNDGSGDVLTDDFFIGSSNFVTPTVGSSYNVKGIVDFSFSEFKILPRTTADISVTSACIQGVEEAAISFGLYPNPATTSLTIDVDGGHWISVSDMNGRTIQNSFINGLTTVDVSHFEAGIYFLNIEGTVRKFIVE